jgi:hypothetical protein
MPSKIDLMGKRFGRLLVVEEITPDKRGEFRWRCVCDCGEEKTTTGHYLRTGKTTSCGCYRKEVATERIKIWSANSVGKYRREKSHNWKGGRKFTDKGYVDLLVDGHYCLEHRYVMEQHLGRKLLPEENVHHINGVRADNRFENLELWSRSQPPGQRVVDKVKWAHEILDQYKEFDNDRSESARY